MPRWEHMNRKAKVMAVRGMSRRNIDTEGMARNLGTTVDAIQELARDEDIFIGDIWSAPDSIKRAVFARRASEAARLRLREISEEGAT